MRKLKAFQAFAILLFVPAHLCAKYIDPATAGSAYVWDSPAMALHVRLNKEVIEYSNRLPASIKRTYSLGNPPTAPIQIGGSIDDACGGGGFLDGPTYFFYRPKILNRNGTVSFGKPLYTVLPAGTTLFLCGSLGAYTRVVVYHPAIGCGVSTPINPRQTYTGPCWSGWIETERIVQTAG